MFLGRTQPVVRRDHRIEGSHVSSCDLGQVASRFCFGFSATPWEMQGFDELVPKLLPALMFQETIFVTSQVGDLRCRMQRKTKPQGPFPKVKHFKRVM